MLKFATGLALAASASAAAADWRVVDSQVGDVDLVFAIKANSEALSSAFEQHTRPGRVQAHLSRDEVTALAGNAAGAEVVARTLQAAGASRVEKSRGLDFVTATLPEAAAEQLLQTDFARYAHGPSGREAVVGPSQTLPAALAEHVHFASKNRFPGVARRHAPSVSPNGGCADCDGAVTPAVIREVYNVDVEDAGGVATLGIFASLNQSINQNDIAAFDEMFGLPETKWVISGPNDPDACVGEGAFNDCGEAELDTEWVSGVAPNLKEATFWSYEANAEGNEPFNDFMVDLLAQDEPPHVVSMSYGDDERDVDAGEMAAYNENAQKLGLMGVSVIASSGDDGAAGYYIRTDPDTACAFWVASFPASSPYTTAVGASQGPEAGDPEIVCQSNEGGVITSGGGFSTVFAMPDYQSELVGAYLASGDVPPAQYFNASGRAAPDVSLLGFNYTTILGGEVAAVSGTSASAPTFASLVALVNARRIADGKPTLGFLNTNMYDLAADADNGIFRDITQGMNNCGAGHDVSDLNCCDTGFEAVEGYDPATGLGSIDFANFRETFEAL